MAIARGRVPGRWFRIRATIPRDAEDQVLGLLAFSGSVGSTTGPAGRARLRCEAWFSTFEGAAGAMAALASRPGVRIGGTGPETIEDEGWLDASLRERPPVIAGPVVVVERPLAGTSLPPLPGQREIVIPASRAFGTGEHATTKMCLELLASRVRAGARVLDLGTGSGILAIAAARFGATRVLAIDSDGTALEIAAENVVRNGVGKRVALAAGSWGALATDAAYDLVLANIHRTALVRGARALSSRMAGGGAAILSGFLRADEEGVVEAWARHGTIAEERTHQGEWGAVVMRRERGEA